MKLVRTNREGRCSRYPLSLSLAESSSPTSFSAPGLFVLQASGGPDFKRIGYEFDLEADSTQEIPTAVAHSVGDEDRGGEEEDRERHCNYLMKVRGIDTSHLFRSNPPPL